MAVQITQKQAFMREPGAVLGIASYVAATLSFLLQTQWHHGYAELETFIVPAIPWLLTVCLLLKFRRQPLKKYWWVLPTLVIANPLLFVLGFMMLAWTVGGFV